MTGKRPPWFQGGIFWREDELDSGTSFGGVPATIADVEPAPRVGLTSIDDPTVVSACAEVIRLVKYVVAKPAMTRLALNPGPLRCGR